MAATRLLGSACVDHSFLPVATARRVLGGVHYSQSLLTPFAADVQRQISDEELQAANPIMALLQTLMPWVSVAGEAAQAAGRTEEDLLAQVPGLTEFLAGRGIDLTRQVPAAERPRVLELVREYLLRQHGGGGA